MDSQTNLETTQINFKLLTKCPAEKLTKLLHSICDRLCGIQAQVNYSSDFAAIYSLDEWWDVVDASQNALRNLIRNKDYIKDIHLSPDYLKVFNDCIISRNEELRQTLLNETILSDAKSYLKNFDWKLKLVMGSDKMSDMKEALVSLQFQVQEGVENTEFMLEMNKHELVQVVTALENANKAMGQLQT